eukprot:CAMPEP_0119020210 /NCGR_PEP_ID=MMETSP1176-20130426/23584_1 /TAXON_ID=265551 /ORGANISM="Synedropsis recta cf, Strain CCMP1620" /LENGTH=72 /DNA_ID=CAMNT_0006974603 /DNA_START=195 /DNA_END=410 /DNA_ORIENTATION=+
MPSYLPKLLPKCDYEQVDAGDATTNIDSCATTIDTSTKCISIGRPGGIEQLRIVSLQPNIVTKGYNVGVDGS